MDNKIDIKISNSIKLNGEYSCFVSFEYDSDIIECIRQFPSRYYNKDTKCWEIPLNKLKVIVDTFSNNYEIHIYGDYVDLTPVNVQLPKQFKYKTKPYTHQIEGVNYGLTHNNWLLGDEQGLGKALSLNTKIYTPNGYKLMRDIKVGDFVFGRNGKPTRVTAVYNHTNVEMYRIHFSDGRTIECCKDHLWKINKGGRSKIVDTQWLVGKDQFGRERSKNLKKLGYYIDRCAPVEFNSKDIIIDPYVLGVLIGDGCIVKGVGLTTADQEVVDNINKRLPEGYYLNSSKSMENIDYNIISRTSTNRNESIYYANDKRIGNFDNVVDWLISNKKVRTTNRLSIYKYLYPKALQVNSFRYGYNWRIEQPKTRKSNIIKAELENLNLLGTNSHTKFIPELYKYNSTEVRLDILRGLIDSDGYTTNDNLIQYTTVSKQLAEDVRWIVESLGGIVSWTEKVCGYNNKITGKQYTLTIKIDNPQDLCLLTRKKNKLHPRKFKPRRNIVKIEKLPNNNAKCITVDNSEHLYLAEHFIVTHNTKQVIDIAVAEKLKNNYQHCLIVCGVNTLKWNWYEEVRIHSNEKARLIGMKPNGKIGSSADKLNDLINIDKIKEYFLIINVESLRNQQIVDNLQKLCKNKTIGIVAVDEIHRCKNPTSQQGKGLLKLNAEHKIAMTGTPLMNTPLDLFVILKWLGFEKHSFYAFKKHFCNMGGFGGYEIIGYKNLKELQETLNDIMLRRLKQDVVDLPDKIYVNEFVDLTPKQEQIYKEVKNEVACNIDKIKASNNPLAELIRMRQATGYTGILSSTIKESGKIDRLEELVEDAVSNGDKVIIFSNWTAMTTPIYEKLSKKYKGVVITGETKDSERQQNVNKFQTDETCKFCLGTIGAMGTGLTLTAANTVIFIDEPWTMAAKQQAIDRAHRIGTKENVTIYTLMAKNTIDERIHELVEKKGAMSDAIVDNKIVGNKLELLEFLIN